MTQVASWIWVWGRLTLRALTHSPSGACSLEIWLAWAVLSFLLGWEKDFFGLFEGGSPSQTLLLFALEAHDATQTELGLLSGRYLLLRRYFQFVVVSLHRVLQVHLTMVRRDLGSVGLLLNRIQHSQVQTRRVLVWFHRGRLNLLFHFGR